MNHFLVTGANRGIGLALTRQLLAAGRPVVATCRPTGTRRDLETLQRAHPQLMVVDLDMLHSDEINRLPTSLAERGVVVDALVLNAGIAAPSESIGTITDSSIATVFATNVIGPALMIQAFAEDPLALQRDAKIVCISSDLGSISTASDLTYGLSYGVSKAALNMTVKKLSGPLSARGVTIVAMHPGWVRTDLGGPHAELSTDESADAMLTTIAGLTQRDTGSFIDRHGRAVPW